MVLASSSIYRAAFIDESRTLLDVRSYSDRTKCRSRSNTLSLLAIAAGLEDCGRCLSACLPMERSLKRNLGF